MTIILTAILALLPPEVEIETWAILRGVDPAVALAIHQTESGDVPEPDQFPDVTKMIHRDNVVSLGNIGRMQVNCPTWKRLTGQPDCEPLKNRHVNILAGVTIAARWQAKCRKRSRLCQRPAGVHWACHYNEGYVCGPHGIAYARKVARRVRRLR